MRCLIILLMLLCSSAWAAKQPVNQTDIETAELKLLNALDETRGWCVDLFAHRTGALPIGGFQGHNCFMYMGFGPTEDQGFVVETAKKEGRFHLLYWDVCMTLHENKAGSFVAAEACTDELGQKFTWADDGRITPDAAPELCLTMGKHSVPGGGRLAPVGTRPPKSNEKIHLIRRLSFENCSEEETKLQQWGLRNVYAEEERTEPMRYAD